MIVVVTDDQTGATMSIEITDASVAFHMSGRIVRVSRDDGRRVRQLLECLG